MDVGIDGSPSPFQASDGGVERRSDVYEGSVDIGGQLLHTDSCCEGDQGNHQGVLDQILTFFLQQQGLHLRGQLQHCFFHLLPPGRAIFRACRALLS
jgi:hypothetical protein